MTADHRDGKDPRDALQGTGARISLVAAARLVRHSPERFVAFPVLGKSPSGLPEGRPEAIVFLKDASAARMGRAVGRQSARK